MRDTKQILCNKYQLIGATFLLASALSSFAADKTPGKHGPDLGDQRVLVLIDRGPRLDHPGPSAQLGSEWKYESVQVIMFIDRACNLPLIEKRGMHAYADSSGIGCWYPVLGGKYAVIMEDGRVEGPTPLKPTPLQTAIFHTGARETFTITGTADF